MTYLSVTWNDLVQVSILVFCFVSHFVQRKSFADVHEALERYKKVARVVGPHIPNSNVFSSSVRRTYWSERGDIINALDQDLQDVECIEVFEYLKTRLSDLEAHRRSMGFYFAKYPKKVGPSVIVVVYSHSHLVKEDKVDVKNSSSELKVALNKLNAPGSP